jgi:hypothetical protein
MHVLNVVYCDVAKGGEETTEPAGALLLVARGVAADLLRFQVVGDRQRKTGRGAPRLLVVHFMGPPRGA